MSATNAVLTVCKAGTGILGGICVVGVALAELEHAHGRGAICVAPVELDLTVATGLDAAGVVTLNAAHARPRVVTEDWRE